MYKIYFSPSYERKLRKIIKKSPQLKAKIKKQTKLLLVDPKNSSLRLHKLSGNNNWSISITEDIRIIVSIRHDIILCIDIGTHDEVY